MHSTLSLPSLPDLLLSELVASDRVISIDQIEITAYLYSTELLEIELF